MATTSTSGIGTLSQSGSSFRLTGSSSSLDTDAMVEALSAAKRLPAARLEERIETNTTRLTAFSELGAKMKTLKDALAGLRNPPGFLGVNDNLFARKDVYYRSDSTTSPTSLLAVSAGNGTAAGSFEVQVDQLATARKAMSAAIGDSTAQLSTQVTPAGAFSSTIEIGLADRAPVSIAVTGSMSLQDLRSAINAQTSNTGVSASILKEAEGAWRLVLTGTETGKEVALAQTGDDVLGMLGISADGGATFANSLQTAQQAQLRVDGVLINRSSNQVTDAIDGMTFSLLRAEPGTTITVDVEASVGAVKEQIASFVTAYNDLKSFTKTQSTVGSDGEVSEESALFGDSTLRTLAQGVDGLLAPGVAGLGAGALSSLASIGITLDQSNQLVIDDGKLDNALLTDLDGVRDVLEFRSTSSSTSLSVFARPDQLKDNAFSVQVTDADADGVPETATIDGIAMEISGKRLVGAKGSIYEGLELLWSGAGSETVEMTATQGVADRLFSYLDNALDSNDGILARATQSIEQSNTRYQSEITRIDERVESYRERLIERFAAMETAMTLAKSMMTQVQAQLGQSSS